MTLLTVAGSDPSGGAGLQADLKSFAALGHHGASAVTCVTVQSTKGVDSVNPVEPGLLESQLENLFADLKFAAAKTGALPEPGLVETAVPFLEELPLVVDPVVAAEAGGSLSSDASIEALREELLPVADVVTPNVGEAEALTGVEVVDGDSAGEAAEALLDFGPSAAVVTGGHLEGAVDVLATEDGLEFLEGSRMEGSFHGTGCVFSSALAAKLGEGDSVLDAVEFAKFFTLRAIEGGMPAGEGSVPVDPCAWVTGGRS